MPSPEKSWFDLFRSKFILIGGILNGIILVFVLYKLFSRRQADTEDQNTDTYKPWQERENPKLV